MKTILAATDFSKVSLNAVEYAAQLALFSKSKLILFNAYSSPPIAVEIPVVYPSPKELETDCMKQLLKIQKKLELKYGHKLKIECKCKIGFAVDAINDFAKRNHVDLIVMGMQGGGYIVEHLIGSITTALMRKSHCPVLSIYQNLKFKPIKKIALACDYMDLDADSALAPLNELVNIFKARVYVLHVIPEYEMTSTILERIKVRKTLGNMKASFYGIAAGNVVKNINTFVSERKMDMVVMVPRKHSFIDTILYEPDTKKMAFHSKVPLLTLHELLKSKKK